MPLSVTESANGQEFILIQENQISLKSCFSISYVNLYFATTKSSLAKWSRMKQNVLMKNWKNMSISLSLANVCVYLIKFMASKLTSRLVLIRQAADIFKELLIWTNHQQSKRKNSKPITVVALMLLVVNAPWIPDANMMHCLKEKIQQEHGFYLHLLTIYWMWF